jgi:hypothetical protein
MRRRLMTAALVTVLALPACGRGEKPAAKPTPRAATAQEVADSLLTQDDLPDGWRVAPSSDDGDDDEAIGCKALDVLAKKDEADDDVEAEREFERSKKGPFLSVSNTTMATNDEVSVDLDEVRKAAQKCSSFATKIEGRPVRVTIATPTGKVLGDETLRLVLKVKYEGVTVLTLRSVLVRVRNHGLDVTTMRAAGQRELDDAEFEDLVELAVDKASRTLP